MRTQSFKLVKETKVSKYVVWALKNLAKARPELFAEGHVPGLTEAAKVLKDSKF